MKAPTAVRTWIEPTSNGLRAYFMPEDEKSTLHIYEAEVK